jgi:hypothetical protein
MIRAGRAALVAAAAVASVLVGAAPARADNDSYLQYLRDHNFSSIMVDLNSNPSVQLSTGYETCDQLRHGIEPTILSTRWGGYPLIVDAAQHELCPDTLGAQP